MTSAGVVTTFLAGRLHAVAVVVVSLIYAGFIQPLVMYWTWNASSFFHANVLAGYVVSVKDAAGGIAIHVSSGLAGLVGSLFLGRRLLKLKDIDESSIGIGSPGENETNNETQPNECFSLKV